MSDPAETTTVVGVNLVVEDFEKTARFYCEVFGFKKGPPIVSEVKPGDKLSRMFQMPDGGTLRGGGLYRPDMIIRMAENSAPKLFGGGGVRPVGQFGGDGFLFVSTDVQATAQLARAHGGTVYYDDTTITETPYDTVWINDPDGLRIQVVGAPLDVVRSSYGGPGVAPKAVPEYRHG